MKKPVDSASIAVPGSISNVGPGFDALSIAVQLYLRVQVLDVVPEDPDTLHCEFGDHAVVQENRVAAAFTYARNEFGEPTPGLRVRICSDIPVRAGLGSSGAAVVAGLRLYESMTMPRPPAEWLRLACVLEGHPDNAAAALMGGMALSCEHGDGRITARSWSWPPGIGIVVATPRVEVATERARGVLASNLSLADAVFNLQHALLLVHAVRGGAAGDLREALRDRWHQSARTPLVRGLGEALALEHPALLGVCLSGSGPSVVGFAEAGQESAVVDLMTTLYADLGLPCTVRPLQPHQPSATPAAVPITL